MSLLSCVPYTNLLRRIHAVLSKPLQKGGKMLRDQWFLVRVMCLTVALLFIGCDKREDSSTKNSASGRTTADDSSVSDGHPQFPDRPAPRIIAPGVEFSEIRITGDGPGLPMMLNLYLPAGQHPAKSLPCILIAPA